MEQSSCQQPEKCTLSDAAAVNGHMYGIDTFVMRQPFIYISISVTEAYLQIHEVVPVWTRVALDVTHQIVPDTFTFSVHVWCSDKSVPD